VVSTTDYYAFGAPMPGRQFNSPSYRYGFNGKEKTDEWNGNSGASYDYGFRIYDPRAGRFLSVDPLTKKYPELTPYQFASNTPIQAIDLDGLERATPQGHTGLPVLDNYYKKHGAVDVDRPQTKSYDQGKKSSSTGLGFEQKFNPLDGQFDNKLRFAGQEIIENPLDRDSRSGEDRILDNRKDLIPTYKVGTITMNFEPATDNSGNPVESTYEMGVLNTEGKETPLVKTTSDKPGSMSADFKLNEGEKLYEKSTGGSTNTGATTTITDPKSDEE